MEDVSANRDNSRGNMYDLGYEKLTLNNAVSREPLFVRPPPAGAGKNDHGTSKDQKKKMAGTNNLTKKKQIQFPVNTARPPVGEGARIVPTPRIPRRASKVVCNKNGHRSRARRQSGAAVVDILEQNDFIGKLNKHILERNDSIRLLKVHKQLLSELEQGAEEEVPVPEDLGYESTPAAEPKPKSGQVMRIYRRKPRRLSGCAMQGSTIDNIKSNMPSLLERENSVYQIQKRIPSRRSSLTF